MRTVDLCFKHQKWLHKFCHKSRDNFHKLDLKVLHAHFNSNRRCYFGWLTDKIGRVERNSRRLLKESQIFWNLAPKPFFWVFERNYWICSWMFEIHVRLLYDWLVNEIWSILMACLLEAAVWRAEIQDMFCFRGHPFYQSIKSCTKINVLQYNALIVLMRRDWFIPSQALYTFWLKRRVCIGNRFMLNLFCSKLAFFDIICQSSSGVNGPKRASFRQVCFFRIVYCEKFLNIGRQNSVFWEDMTDRSTFRVWDPVAGTCLNLTFSSNFSLTAGVILLPVSVKSPIIVSNVFWDWSSELTSQCVAKFCFASVLVLKRA